MNKEAIEVEIYCRVPGATKVCIAGHFNDWSSMENSLSHLNDGLWSLKIDLCRGNHEFKMLIDDIWRCDPGVIISVSVGVVGLVPNVFATANYIIELV